jgi:hypothetical protein
MVNWFVRGSDGGGGFFIRVILAILDRKAPGARVFEARGFQ